MGKRKGSEGNSEHIRMTYSFMFEFISNVYISSYMCIYVYIYICTLRIASLASEKEIRNRS